jgi:hypothetical protein
MFSSGNIKGEIKGNTLHLEIDLSKRLGPSKSGKTMIIATTSGNQQIPGSDVILGLNAYTRR